MIQISVKEDYTLAERAVAETLNEFAQGRREAMSQTGISTAVVMRLGRRISSRIVRKIIRDLRVKRHAPIVSTYKGNKEGGYFIPQTAEEVEPFVKRVHGHAIKMLAMESAVKKMVNECFPQVELLFDRARQAAPLQNAGNGKEAA